MDLVTIVTLVLVGLQETGPILFIPTVLVVLFLASKTQSSTNIPRSLGLFSYGLSRREMLIGQYFKGASLQALSLLLLELATRMGLLHAQSLLTIAIPTIALAGFVYLLPSADQLRSDGFVGLLKN